MQNPAPKPNDFRMAIALIIMLLLCAGAAIFRNWPLLIGGLVGTAAYGVYGLLTGERYKKRVLRYLHRLNTAVSNSSGEALMKFPIPVVVVRFNGEIIWYNTKFADVLGNEPHFEKNLRECIPGVDIGSVLEEKQDAGEEIVFRNRHFQLFGNVVQRNAPASGALFVLYFIEKTETYQMKEKYRKSRVAAAHIVIDNYDELLQNAKETERAAALSKLDRVLEGWMDGVVGVIRRTERDRYLYFFEEHYLEQFIKSRFFVLDNAREVLVAGNQPVTLSIGIGSGGENIAVNYEAAKQAIDMALGRGGDQVVIKRENENDFEFYGGKSKALERRTKVRARVIATALADLIRNSDNVLIMGHKFGDLDSLGASVGIYRAARHFGKPAHIILNKNTTMALDNVLKLEEHPDYTSAFVMPGDAQDLVRRNSLLVIVDTHRVGSLEAVNVYNNCQNIAMIDHHRRGADYIDNAALSFHETFSSSASEMVSELLQYMDEGSYLLKQEAEVLLAGIVLDTRNFTFNTGVRTFEAAAYLKRMGADTVNVMKMFRTDLSDYRSRMKIISQAQIYRQDIAISVWEGQQPEDAMKVASQAADELLEIAGINVSFVMYPLPDYIQVSARSLETVNVQMILEKIGGGGHPTLAAAQIVDVTMDEALEMLKKAIDDYLSDNE